MKSVFVGIKNVLLWSYARGTWQYDVLCALIVLTLLFWPKGKAAPTAIAKTTTAVANVPSAARHPRFRVRRARAANWTLAVRAPAAATSKSPATQATPPANPLTKLEKQT